MKLYTYYRSGSTYRVRIALALKGLEYEPEYIVVAPNSPDLNNDAYVKLNPQRTAPTFVDGDLVLTQSMAIIEYLEETHPEPALLPKNPTERARIRKIALAMIADTHALCVQRVSHYMANKLDIDQPKNQEMAPRLDDPGLGYRRDVSGRRCRHRHVLSWRGAEPGGCHPGAAGLYLTTL